MLVGYRMHRMRGARMMALLWLMWLAAAMPAQAQIAQSISLAPAVSQAGSTVNGSTVLTDDNLSTANTTQTNQFKGIAVALPAVTGISPSSGSTTGGTSVTITGVNFTNVTAVSFGGTAATSFTVNSATSITATSPASSAGTVDVTVTTTLGTSATSPSDQFLYMDPLSAATSVASTTLTVNQPSVSFTPVTGSGGTGTLTYSIISPTTGLPAGLAMSTAGLITGSPTAASGATQYTVQVEDANNETATASFSLTVDQATPTVTAWPTASAITYGQTLASSTLVGGASSVAGTFAWTTPATSPNAGSQTEPVTFTPTDTTNYATVTGSVTVQVNQATPVITWNPATTITHGTSLAGLLNATVSGVSGSFTYTAGTTAVTAASVLDAGTYTLTATFTPTAGSADAANYTTATKAVTLSIGQDTTSITLSASPNPTIAGQPVTLTATVFGDPPTGTVTFYDGAAELGTGTLATLDATSSIATLTIATLTAGTHDLSAVYDGDSNNRASAAGDGQTVLQVNAAASSLTPAPALTPWMLALLALLLGGLGYRAARRDA